MKEYWVIEYTRTQYEWAGDVRIPVKSETRYYSAKGVSSAPTLFETEGKANARLKTHFNTVNGDRVVKVMLKGVEE